MLVIRGLIFVILRYLIQLDKKEKQLKCPAKCFLMFENNESDRFDSAMIIEFEISMLKDKGDE